MTGKTFTHSVYAGILDVLKDSGRKGGSVEDFLTRNDRQEPCFIMRHDVDRWPQQAVRLAQLEHECCIRTTYYFRATTAGRFSAQAIRTIADLGHEVGYHYETLSACKGNMKIAHEVFARNLERFRGIAPCATVSMHGAPLSPHDNLNLLREVDLRRFGLVGDAVLSFSGMDIIYYTDTGGRWNAGRDINIRDFMRTTHAPGSVVPSSLDAFGAFLKTTQSVIYINSHPERWAHNAFTMLVCRGLDFGSNMIKRFWAVKRAR